MASNQASPTLQGYRIALTVAADDPISPATQIRDLGGELLYYPVAELLPPDNFDELDAALQKWQKGEIDWLLMPTPRAAAAIAERLAHLGLSASDLAQVKVAAYGAKTQLTLAANFPTWQNALPHLNTHEQVIDAMQLNNNTTVLIPVALHSRTDWPKLVRAAHAEAIVVPAYRLLLGRGGDDLPALLWGGLVDAVVFLTENGVRHFVIRLKAEGGTPAMLDHVPVACLDPQTATAAQAFGFRVQVLPTDFSFASLVEGLAQYLSARAIEA